MDFVNESGLPAGWTLGFDPDGRELLIVAVKATYRIPEADTDPVLAENQVALTEADEFAGEPGYSAPLHETDYAHRKPYCDVLLNGSAYAPDGRPVDQVQVSLQVASMKKSFWVFGDRKWDGVVTVFPTDPEFFTKQPISYDRAYGGCDFDEAYPERTDTFRFNPIGVGYHPMRFPSQLAGKPLPNTAADGTPITDRKGKFRPMSFGPVGRNFDPRFRFAGTYDGEWLDHRAPFWPDDFNYRYFQAAPEDQQIPHLQGGEEVILKNLTTSGARSFRIPHRAMPVMFLPHRGSDQRLEAVCDTLLLEPDNGHFILTWRASLPVRQSCFDIKQVIVGEMPYSWHSQRRAVNTGKTYYRNLTDALAKRPTGTNEVSG